MMLGHAQQVVDSVNKAAVDVAREHSCDKDTTGPPPELFSLPSLSQRSQSPPSSGYPVEIFLTCFLLPASSPPSYLWRTILASHFKVPYS